MKKGELRKDTILNTAEQLFFKKGFDETSIQDILDALDISKGGFYHYFDSKGALLEAICRKRSAADIERMKTELRLGKLTPVQKLNRLLGTINIFNHSDARYAALVLKTGYIDGDVHFRDQMRRFMTEELTPMLDMALREGMDDESFFIRNPGKMGRLILMLAYDVNDETCRVLTDGRDNPETVIEIMDLLDTYREGIETLLGAKFGSISLFDVEHLLEAFRQTAVELQLVTEA